MTYCVFAKVILSYRARSASKTLCSIKYKELKSIELGGEEMRKVKVIRRAVRIEALRCGCLSVPVACGNPVVSKF